MPKRHRQRDEIYEVIITSMRGVCVAYDLLVFRFLQYNQLMLWRVEDAMGNGRNHRNHRKEVMFVCVTNSWNNYSSLRAYNCIEMTSHAICEHYEVLCTFHPWPTVDCVSLSPRFVHFGGHIWHQRFVWYSICVQSPNTFVLNAPSPKLVERSSKYEVNVTLIGEKKNKFVNSPVRFGDLVQKWPRPVAISSDFWVVHVQWRFVVFDLPIIVYFYCQDSYRIPFKLKIIFTQFLCFQMKAFRITSGSAAMKLWTFAILATSIISSIVTRRELSP